MSEVVAVAIKVYYIFGLVYHQTVKMSSNSFENID